MNSRNFSLRKVIQSLNLAAGLVGAILVPLARSHAANVPKAGGGDHTCALLEDKTVACWGANDRGQLGLGDTLDRSVPTAVPGLARVVDLALGAQHTCAVSEPSGLPNEPSDFVVRCWGDNQSGQLAIGASDNQPHPSPQVVWVDPTLSYDSPTFLALGGWQTFRYFTATSPQLYGAGSNAFGQIGNGGYVDQDRLVPLAEASINSFARGLSTGLAHTCEVVRPEKLFCWGANNRGQLGIGNLADSNRPVEVAPVTNIFSSFASVAAGGAHSCSIVDRTVDGGKVVCWGANGAAQLGNGTTTDSSRPRRTFYISNATMLALGGAHSCALSAGVTECWGDNTHGQLGIGTQDPNRIIPTPVPNMEADILVAGASHTCAHRRNGRIACWGKNDRGQLGLGTVGDDVTVPTDISDSIFTNGFDL